MHETILAEISYFLFELAETKYFGDFIFLVAMNCIRDRFLFKRLIAGYSWQIHVKDTD